MPPTVLVSKPDELGDAVVLVDHRRARAQVGEGGDARRVRGPAGRALASGGCAAAGARARSASFSCGARKPSRRPAWANSHARLGGGRPAVEEVGVDAGEVVARRARPRRGAPRPRSCGSRSARASRARARPRAASGRPCRRSGRGTRAAGRCEMLDRRSSARAVERRVEPVRAARRGGGRPRRGSSWSRPPSSRAATGASSSSAATAISASSGTRSSSSRKRSTGSTSATSGRSRLVGRGGDLGQLAVLGAELGRRRDLHPLGLLERALGEGGEPGEPLHLDVEELAAHGALLGGRVDVEDVAAQRELAAVLHLVDALVAAGHELVGGLVEVEQPALLDLEAVRAQLGVGHLLGERRRRTATSTAGLLPRGARRARRCAGRPGAAAGRGATRSARRGPGRSAPGGARGRRSGRRPGRAPRGRRRPPPARAARGRSRAARRAGTGAGWPRRTRAAARVRAASASAVTSGVLVGVCEERAEHAHASRPAAAARLVARF